MSITIYTVPAHAADENGRAAALRRLPPAIHDPVLNRLTAVASTALRTPMAAVTLLRGYDAQLVATTGFPAGVYSRATSLCGHAVLDPRQTFVVPDARADERFAGNPFVAEDGGIRFYAAAQIVADNGVAVGTLCVFDHAPREGLSEAERLSLLRLAEAASERLRVIADATASGRDATSDASGDPAPRT